MIIWCIIRYSQAGGTEAGSFLFLQTWNKKIFIHGWSWLQVVMFVNAYQFWLINLLALRWCWLSWGGVHGVGRMGCVARGGGVVAGCDGLGCNLSSDELGIAIHCTLYRLLQVNCERGVGRNICSAFEPAWRPEAKADKCEQLLCSSGWRPAVDPSPGRRISVINQNSPNRETAAYSNAIRWANSDNNSVTNILSKQIDKFPQYFKTSTSGLLSLRWSTVK